jgi:hypothetical protein
MQSNTAVRAEGAASRAVSEPDSKYVRTLSKLANSWEARAGVRHFTLPDATAYDPALPDFPVDLLPFGRHPAFIDASDEMRLSALACAWLVFNQKTIDIERHILTPACLSIYDRMAQHMDLHGVIAQTLTDETYHILMTHQASQLTRDQRGLADLRIPRTSVVRAMQEFQEAQSEGWKRDLVLVATAISTEVFICGYLRRLADATDIQPHNAAVTRAHLQDELAHASVFKAVAQFLCSELSPTERRFFVKCIVMSVRWFGASEADVWTAVLEQLGFRRHATIVGDCVALSKGNHADMDPVKHFLAELGVAGEDDLAELR